MGSLGGGGFGFLTLSNVGGMVVFNYLTIAEGVGWFSKDLQLFFDVINGQPLLTDQLKHFLVIFWPASFSPNALLTFS